MAMIAITTSNSIRVKPHILFLDKTIWLNAVYINTHFILHRFRFCIADFD
jgi:hypothetical protein